MALPIPTALAATSRYIPVGLRRYVWVPTISNKNAPTSAEITAGTDLTGEVVADGVAGFTTTSATVDTPDFGNRFTSKVPGMITSDDSSIRLYTSSTSTDARTLLTRDLAGYMCVFHEGIVTGGKMSVFPAKITVSMVEQGGADAAGSLMVGFAITSTPAENIAVPTV